MLNVYHLIDVPLWQNLAQIFLCLFYIYFKGIEKYILSNTYINDKLCSITFLELNHMIWKTGRLYLYDIICLLNVVSYQSNLPTTTFVNNSRRVQFGYNLYNNLINGNSTTRIHDKVLLLIALMANYKTCSFLICFDRLLNYLIA